MEFNVMWAFPAPDVEKAWRNLLHRVELPTHYTAPEFFLEKRLSSRRLVAVLSMHQGIATGVLTGAHASHRTMSGLSVRPPLCLDRHTDKRAGIQSLMRGAGGSGIIRLD